MLSLRKARSSSRCVGRLATVMAAMPHAMGLSDTSCTLATGPPAGMQGDVEREAPVEQEATAAADEGQQVGAELPMSKNQMKKLRKKQL
jgi:hypothetical protein